MVDEKDEKDKRKIEPLKHRKMSEEIHKKVSEERKMHMSASKASSNNPTMSIIVEGEPQEQASAIAPSVHSTKSGIPKVVSTSLEGPVLASSKKQRTRNRKISLLPTTKAKKDFRTTYGEKMARTSMEQYRETSVARPPEKFQATDYTGGSWVLQHPKKSRNISYTQTGFWTNIHERGKPHKK